MSPALADMQGRSRKRMSAVDRLPNEILVQLVAARERGTHSVSDMIEWLHDCFDADYSHITKAMLDSWFLRKGFRAYSK